MNAAFFNAFDDLFLDPETVVKMQAEICQVASRYADKPCTTPEARRVLFTMQGFPYGPNDSPQRPRPSVAVDGAVTAEHVDVPQRRPLIARN